MSIKTKKIYTIHEVYRVEEDEYEQLIGRITDQYAARYRFNAEDDAYYTVEELREIANQVEQLNKAEK